MERLSEGSNAASIRVAYDTTCTRGFAPLSLVWIVKPWLRRPK